MKIQRASCLFDRDALQGMRIDHRWFGVSLEAGRYRAAFIVRKKMSANVRMRAGCRIAASGFAKS